MNYRYLLITLILLGTGFTSLSQNLKKTIDEIVEEKYKPGEPGAAILVARDGNIIHRNAYGMANLELDAPMDPDMVFQIGSITKQFTAVGVLMLYEKGKLSLEDDITKYLEDYPTHGHKITIHDLLTHTSGIKSYTSLSNWQEKWREDVKAGEFIEFFKNEPMDFAPGEKFMYNNSAYFLLGYIIEKVSGQKYPEFIEENIFKPLEMDDSYYGSKKQLIKKRADGYHKKDGFTNAEYLSLTQPYSAGSVMSTVDDFYKWQKGLMSEKLIKKETLEKAFTNYKLNNGEHINYGYGWFINEINGISTVEHGGGIFGYTSNAIYIPEKDILVVMFTNRDDFSPSEVSTRIAAHTINKPYPGEKDKINLKNSYLQSLTGVYEFEDGIIRYISYEDGQLYSQRKGSSKLNIFPYEKNRFFFEGSFTTYEFIKKNGDIELVFKNRINETKGKRTDTNLPKKEEKEISETDPEILEQYTGEYVLQPNFSIVISLEGNQLKAKATGQGKYEIYPLSKTRFFYKVVDAEIEFVQNKEGKTDALILYQGGQEIKGIKQ